jgi:hypothetical protein
MAKSQKASKGGRKQGRHSRKPCGGSAQTRRTERNKAFARHRHAEMLESHAERKRLLREAA